MFGNLIGFVLVLFLVSFAIGTVSMIFKELISRRKRASGAQNTKSEEVDSSDDSSKE